MSRIMKATGDYLKSTCPVCGAHFFNKTYIMWKHASKHQVDQDTSKLVIWWKRLTHKV